MIEEIKSYHNICTKAGFTIWLVFYHLSRIDLLFYLILDNKLILNYNLKRNYANPK
jgi:hypothetical protein